MTAYGDVGYLYLDLLKRALTDSIHIERRGGDIEQRRLGMDLPEHADTMVGLRRLDNIQVCIEDVVVKSVPGDLVETGVWRGGATILMRACLKVLGVMDRRVWVCDSFRGLPPPKPDLYPADRGDTHHTADQLRASLAEVRRNFNKYGLLDDQVQFLEGWFQDTLPAAPIDRIAVLRLDGDMYESTIVALDALYGKLSPGGFLIVDDLTIPSCHRAVDDFRTKRGIADPITVVDWTCGFWQKSGPATTPTPAGASDPAIAERQRRAAMAAVEAGQAALAAGDVVSARRRAEQALERAPDLAEARELLARLGS